MNLVFKGREGGGGGGTVECLPNFFMEDCNELT